MLSLIITGSDDMAKSCVSWIRSSNNNKILMIDDPNTRSIVHVIYIMRKEYVSDTKLSENDLMF